LDQFSTTQENVISNQLENVIVKEKEIQVENSGGTRIYRIFVLVELDENAAQDKLLAQIKADQQLYDAIKASELIDEMEQKVEAYRQRK
jgi:putative heme degradation protein